MYKLTNSTTVTRLSDSACIPADPANADYIAYMEWLDGGNTPDPVDAPTAEQLQAQLTAVIQNYLDEAAQQIGYDGILSLCSYATSTVPKFQAEGVTGVALRDACWLRGGGLLAEVEAEVRPVPTEAELIALLPPIEWPV